MVRKVQRTPANGRGLDALDVHLLIQSQTEATKICKNWIQKINLEKHTASALLCSRCLPKPLCPKSLWFWPQFSKFYYLGFCSFQRLPKSPKTNFPISPSWFWSSIGSGSWHARSDLWSLSFWIHLDWIFFQSIQRLEDWLRCLTELQKFSFNLRRREQTWEGVT